MTIDTKKTFTLALLTLVVVCFSGNVSARESKEVRRQQAHKVRQIIQFNLLAIERFILSTENQKIKDPVLYRDALSKAESAKLSYTDIQNKLFPIKRQRISAAFDQFNSDIKNLVTHDKAFTSYVALETLWIATFKPPLEPSQTPDKALGEKTYQAYCSMCHGVNADLSKSLAKKLKPAPVDFHNSVFKKVGSPGRYFMSVLSGIPDTSMDSFREKLTDHEIWSMLFWLMTLNIKDPSKVAECPMPAGLSLTILSHKSDEELAAWLKSTEHLECVRNRWAFDKRVPRD